MRWVPFITVPGGKPVTAVPGLTPKSPETIEFPLFVTVLPANTAKDVAFPKSTGGWAAWALSGSATSSPTAATDATPKRTREAFRAYLGNFMVDPFDGRT